MTTSTLEKWLGERTPDVPAPFLPLLLSFGGAGHPGPDGLWRAGGRAVARALALPGRNRESAFALLSGDALLTYSCEAIADGEGDVGERLDALIRQLGAQFP